MREYQYKLNNPLKNRGLYFVRVGLLGLEPRLFWTKTRRVANYTIDQFKLVNLTDVVLFI